MSEPTLPIHPPDFSSYSPQSQSPLFSVFPPEIRTQIFQYALSPYEDTTRLYSEATYWVRPGYSAPHRTCTSLLQTCKRIYQEAWFMPFALATHTFYLTASERAPGPEHLSRKRFQQSLETIHSIHGDDFKIGDVRIFAQLYILEPGDALQRVFDMPFFAPRRVNLTLRYTDFWHWENNRPLYVDSRWVNKVLFPGSVHTFRMDFESLERRRGEVDVLVEQAVEKWFFKRRDGKILTARMADVTVSKWTGASMFGGRRWVRDEVRAGELDYYVKSAVWRVSPSPTSASGENEMGNLDVEKKCPTVQVPPDFVQATPPFTGWVSLDGSEMLRAGVTLDMPAEEAVADVQGFRRQNAAATARSISLGRAMMMRDRLGGRGH